MQSIVGGPDRIEVQWLEGEPRKDGRYAARGLRVTAERLHFRPLFVQATRSGKWKMAVDDVRNCRRLVRPAVEFRHAKERRDARGVGASGSRRRVGTVGRGPSG